MTFFPRFKNNIYFMVKSTSGLSVRTRLAYAARSVLPVLVPGKKLSHFELITDPLLTKLVRSRWLNIVLVPFAFFSDLAGCHLVDKNAKKELGQYSAILTTRLFINT